jgi:hypothetical protein
MMTKKEAKMRDFETDAGEAFAEVVKIYEEKFPAGFE